MTPPHATAKSCVSHSTPSSLASSPSPLLIVSTSLRSVIALFISIFTFCLASNPGCQRLVDRPIFALCCQDPQRTRRLASRASLGTSHTRTRRRLDLGSAFPSLYVFVILLVCYSRVPSLDSYFLLSQPVFLDTAIASSSRLSSRPGYKHPFSLRHLTFIAVWVCPRQKQFYTPWFFLFLLTRFVTYLFSRVRLCVI